MGRFFCGISPGERESSLVPVSQTPWDVNGDGIVNVQDLTLVARVSDRFHPMLTAMVSSISWI